MARAGPPVDRFFDLSVGSDYPGHADPRRQPGPAQDRGRRARLPLYPLPRHLPRRAGHGARRRRPASPTTGPGSTSSTTTCSPATSGRSSSSASRPRRWRPRDNSIFYWKGNTSHPKPAAGATWSTPSPAISRAATARTRCAAGISRCGTSPTSRGFWEGADQKAYFELYDLHRADDEGGRSGAAGRRPVDRRRGLGAGIPRPCRGERRADRFRHHPHLRRRRRLPRRERQERHQAVALARRDRRRCAPGARADRARRTFPHLPLYFTEWSTSYTPRDPVHDSYVSAPYILSKLKAARACSRA